MKNECQWLTILTNKDRKVTLKLFLILAHNCQNIVPWPPEIALLNTKCPQPQMFYLWHKYTYYFCTKLCFMKVKTKCLLVNYQFKSEPERKKNLIRNLI